MNNFSIDQSNPKYLDSFKCEKNTDRVRFIHLNTSNQKNPYVLTACYELNKETNSKSGCLYLHDIDSNNKLTVLEQFNSEYGILDFKFESNSRNLYTSNSDNSLSIFKLMENKSISFVQNFLIPSKDEECTCNTLDIKNLNTNSSILLATNDGYHHIFDLNKSEFITSIKSHDYGLWSCYCIDENLYMTGSEDSLLKLWDLREKKCISVNKTHTASINCIDTLMNQTNVFITGSYDENINFIDIRKFGESIYRQNLNCAIWDIKQNKFKEENLMLMSSIYEGFNIFKYSQEENIISLNNLYSLKIGEKAYKNQDKNYEISHNSIVYGVDSIVKDDELYIVSCSFYDNLVLFWKI